MRWTVVLVILALMLSGCATKKDDGDQAGTTAPAGDTPQDNPLIKVVDKGPKGAETLHLLKAPQVSTAPVGDGDPVQTPFDSVAPGTAADQTLSWSWTVKGKGNLDGHLNATVWVRVPDGSISLATPTSGCTFSFSLSMQSPDQTSSYSTGFCSGDVSLPGPIPTGDVPVSSGELVSQFLADAPVAPGWTMTLRLSTGIANPAGTPLVALGGSTDRDSKLTLGGLAEPFA